MNRHVDATSDSASVVKAEAEVEDSAASADGRVVVGVGASRKGRSTAIRSHAIFWASVSWTKSVRSLPQQVREP